MNIALIYSQSPIKDDHLNVESLYGKKVIINKTVVSYTQTNKGKTHSDINIPFYIIITSDNSSASIRINSKNLREDILMEFKCIHKIKSYDGIDYNFFDYNNDLIASYTIPKDGSHQSLYISFNDEKKSSYLFTISKFNQL